MKQNPITQDGDANGRWHQHEWLKEGSTFVPNDWPNDRLRSENLLGSLWLYATQKWRPTNLWIKEGQEFLVTYHNYWVPGDASKPPIHTVLWRVNPSHKWYGAEGTGGLVGNGYAAPGEREGSLVFKIGENGSPTAYGRKMVADRSGQFYVTANDDVGNFFGNGYGDNEGRINVLIFTY